MISKIKVLTIPANKYVNLAKAIDQGMFSGGVLEYNRSIMGTMNADANMIEADFRKVVSGRGFDFQEISEPCAEIGARKGQAIDDMCLYLDRCYQGVSRQLIGNYDEQITAIRNLPRLEQIYVNNSDLDIAKVVSGELIPLFVALSGPSGAGKGVIDDKLTELMKQTLGLSREALYVARESRPTKSRGTPWNLILEKGPLTPDPVDRNEYISLFKSIDNEPLRAAIIEIQEGVSGQEAAYGVLRDIFKYLSLSDAADLAEAFKDCVTAFLRTDRAIEKALRILDQTSTKDQDKGYFLKWFKYYMDIREEEARKRHDRESQVASAVFQGEVIALAQVREEWHYISKHLLEILEQPGDPDNRTRWLECDIQLVGQVKKALRNNGLSEKAVFIGLVPPDGKTHISRLVFRGTLRPEVLIPRLPIGWREIRQARDVVNAFIINEGTKEELAANFLRATGLGRF